MRCSVFDLVFPQTGVNFVLLQKSTCLLRYLSYLYRQVLLLLRNNSLGKACYRDTGEGTFLELSLKTELNHVG